MRNAPVLAVFVCTAVLAAQAPAHAQDPVEAVVASFYPERLSPPSLQERYACHQVVPTPGGDVLVAAYTDQADGAVRVLRADGAGNYAVVFDNPAAWDLSGRDCLVRVEDVDLDGAPEVLVYFFQNRSSAGWVFRWTGGTLENLTATETNREGRDATLMLGPTVYDLHHEGAMRVVAERELAITAPGVRPRYPAFVYRLGPDGFEVESSVLSLNGFLAGVSSEANQRFFRLVTDSAPPVVLQVINGERDGGNRVTSATITINNEVVLGPDDIHAGVEFVEIELADVFTANELHAALEGDPDARIIVVVADATAR
jgi:hypothetical protein